MCAHSIIINIIVTDNSSVVRNSTTQEFAKPHTPVLENKDQKTYNLVNDNVTNEARFSMLSTTAQVKNAKNDGSLPIDQSSTVEKLFQGMIEV